MAEAAQCTVLQEIQFRVTRPPEPPALAKARPVFVWGVSLQAELFARFTVETP